MGLSGIGKLLLVMAVVLAAVGLLLVAAGKGLIPRLPGDFSFGGRGWRVYVPLGTSIVVSLLLTLLANVFFRR